GGGGGDRGSVVGDHQVGPGVLDHGLVGRDDPIADDGVVPDPSAGDHPLAVGPVVRSTVGVTVTVPVALDTGARLVRVIDDSTLIDRQRVPVGPAGPGGVGGPGPVVGEGALLLRLGHVG